MTFLAGAWRFLGPTGRWAVGVALAVFLLVAGFFWWLSNDRQRIRDEEGLKCEMRAIQSHLAARVALDAKAAELAISNEQRARLNAAADAKDNDRADRIVREVIYASPTAAACVFDQPLADAVNGLRDE